MITLIQLASRLDASYFMIDGQEDKNGLQDVFGCNTSAKLAQFFDGLNNRQKQNFCFVVNQVMSPDSAWEILQATYFAAKIEAVVSSKVSSLTNTVDGLRLRVDRLVSEVQDAELELSAAVASLESASCRVDELEAELACSNDRRDQLQTEVDTMSEFKRSLKQFLLS